MTNELIEAAEPALPPAKLNALQSDLKRFSSCCRELDENSFTEKMLAEYRNIAADLPALRAHWEAVDRPAGASFIATEIARLVIAFPNSGGADPDLFAEIVADDIRAAHPSYYALATAASNYRRKFRFLNISDLFAELEGAERQASRFRYLLEDKVFPMAEKLEFLEADLPRMRKLALENRRRRKERRIVWKRLKAQGCEHEYLLIMDCLPDGIAG